MTMEVEKLSSVKQQIQGQYSPDSLIQNPESGRGNRMPIETQKTEKNRAQLDHILINGKWINSVKNHRIVSAEIKIRLRAPRETKNKRLKFDWRKLKDNEELQEQYTVTIHNRYNALRREDDVMIFSQNMIDS